MVLYRISFVSQQNLWLAAHFFRLSLTRTCIRIEYTVDLRYGKGSINFETPPGFLGVVQPRDIAVRPVDVLLKESFMKPIGLPCLKDILHKNRPGDVVIIVSDISRKIANYSEILEFIAGELVDAGVDEKNIQFVIALGTHRRHTAEESKLLYGGLVRDFNFSEHDCHRDLVSVGTTSTGLDVVINRRVSEADFVIATGRVDFHYLAGYSGGRKSILPGVASYETIRNNHSKLVRNGVGIGQLEGNVIAQEMAEAGSILGIDYLINVVETPTRETAQIFSGHHDYAFEEAVQQFTRARQAKIPEKADCVIVSAGGYPNDENFYHTHKSINLAIRALKRGGSVILVGQCIEGFGNERFMQLMLDNEMEALLKYPEEKIEVGGHRAFLTVKILKNHRVYALTDLEPNVVRQIGFTPIKDIKEGIEAVKKEHGEGLKTLIVPNGKAVLPSMNGERGTPYQSGG